MAEMDVIWMSLLVFMPSFFALGLIFFPRRAEAAMCWWSLAGTAVTLGIAVAIFINYKVNVLDLHGALKERAERERMSLPARAAAMDQAMGSDVALPTLSDDWVARYPWIARF